MFTHASRPLPYSNIYHHLFFWGGGGGGGEVFFFFFSWVSGCGKTLFAACKWQLQKVCAVREIGTGSTRGALIEAECKARMMFLLFIFNFSANMPTKGCDSSTGRRW